MIKIGYIISNVDKALAFEWIFDHIDKDKYNIFFILLNPGESKIEAILREKKALVYRVKYNTKKDGLRAIFNIIDILRKERPSVVHTHLFEASLFGLLAARLSFVKNRIYTRHHATLHHEKFPRAVFYDRIINSLATHIVAPSENVKEILLDMEGVSKRKVSVIHHGFDLKAFEEVRQQEINLSKEKYNKEYKSPVVGVISRYEDWKGIQFIIPAFNKLLEVYPNAKLILANAKGSYSDKIKELLSSLPHGSYTEIVFEGNIQALYKTFDVFIHTPINARSEAFGQTYIEALAAGVPSVFTLSGVAREVIDDGNNALVVPFQDSESIYTSLIKLLSDSDLRKRLIQKGESDIKEKFSLDLMISSLEQLYAS